MRELIIKRLEEIKHEHDGFHKDSGRWTMFYTDGGTHLSMVDFNILPDGHLLSIFERIIFVTAKQR